MTAKAPAPPSGLELERKLVAERERGRRVGAEADGQRHVAEARFAAAEREREQAIEAQVRNEPGADERLSAALQAVREAADDIAAARERGDAGRRVFQQSEARLHQTRQALLDELAPSAEELTEDALVARAALAEPLREFQRKYALAAARWRQLAAGCRAKVEQMDADAGLYRNEDRIDAEASPPEFPISFEHIEKLLNTAPRPACMTEGYRPGQPVEPHSTEHSGPTILFPGHPDYQRHAYPPVEQDPSEVVMMNSRHGPAPSEQELREREVKRIRAELKNVGE